MPVHASLLAWTRAASVAQHTFHRGTKAQHAHKKRTEVACARSRQCPTCVVGVLPNVLTLHSVP
eukprot:scaffold3716_cov23-Tisochrysis_lutea.AAC.5